MIDVVPSQSLAQAIGARRETLRYLDRLTREIAARQKAGDDSEGSEPARRWSGRRFHHQQFLDRLTFEWWSELDEIVCRLATQ